MYEGNTVGVVIPAYNEEEFIGDVLKSIPSYVDRIYAIDDASTDDTWDEIQQHAEWLNGGETVIASGETREEETVIPIQHNENQGVGGAIKTGYVRAMEDRIDIAVVVAGDGQMDSRDIERIIQPIVRGKADYVKGNRLLSSQARGEMPAFRFVGNAILTLLTKIASGYWTIDDPQNGYTAISLRALETVDIEDMYEFYGYCNDLLVKLNANEMRVSDVPVRVRYKNETSHINYSSYIPRVSGMLLRNHLWRLKQRYVVNEFHPLVFLYALGTALGASGVGIGLFSGNDEGESSSRSGPMALLYLLLAGICYTFAMIFDRQENEDLNVKFHDPDLLDRADEHPHSQPAREERP